MSEEKSGDTISLFYSKERAEKNLRHGQQPDVILIKGKDGEADSGPFLVTRSIIKRGSERDNLFYSHVANYMNHHRDPADLLHAVFNESSRFYKGPTESCVTLVEDDRVSYMGVIFAQAQGIDVSAGAIRALAAEPSATSLPSRPPQP